MNEVTTFKRPRPSPRALLKVSLTDQRQSFPSLALRLRTVFFPALTTTDTEPLHALEVVTLVGRLRLPLSENVNGALRSRDVFTLAVSARAATRFGVGVGVGEGVGDGLGAGPGGVTSGGLPVAGSSSNAAVRAGLAKSNRPVMLVFGAGKASNELPPSCPVPQLSSMKRRIDVWSVTVWSTALTFE